MENLRAEYENGILTIYPQYYIMGRWYIEYHGHDWKVLEASEGGYEPEFMGNYPSFKVAHKKAKSLS